MGLLSLPGPGVVTIFALLLLAGVLTYVALRLLQRGRRSDIGLSGTTLVAVDDSHIGSPTLRSERLRRIGRPDHLVRTGGQLIPWNRSHALGACTTLM